MRLQTLRQKGTPTALTALRVVLGLVFAAHGWLKLTGFAEWKSNAAAMGIPAPEVMAPLAVAGEFLGGIGLMLGVLTPLAAAGAAAVMITAIVTVHLPNGLLAKNNGFEFPLTLLAASLFFVFRGAGPVSVDALVSRLRHRRRGETPGGGDRAASAA